MSEELAIPVPPSIVDGLAELVADRVREKRRWAEIGGVADYLGVSLSRVRYMRSIGMPAKRVGKRLLFDLREVDAWLEAQ